MIHAEQLSKRFGHVTAIDRLSFEIHPGETFALIGPNGAGKTTTLKILLGLTRPDSGSVAIGPERRAPSDPVARRGLGYVPQRVTFPPARTVEEVLGFFADLRGLPRDAVGAALRRVGLESIATRRASELSGGYSQRLSLAQALLGTPALLVLDEPTASLDPEATWEFRSLVERLRREGVTILLCSHLLSEVERVADRVLILLEGRCAALESLDRLRARQLTATHLAVDVGPAPAAAIALLTGAGRAAVVADDGRIAIDATNGQGLEALEALRDAGVPVRSFEMQRPTLEEIFLQVVRGGHRAE